MRLKVKNSQYTDKKLCGTQRTNGPSGSTLTRRGFNSAMNVADSFNLLPLSCCRACMHGGSLLLHSNG